MSPAKALRPETLNKAPQDSLLQGLSFVPELRGKSTI